MKIGKKQLHMYGVFITVILCLSLIAMLVYGFRKKDSIEDDGKITIGFCADNLVIERWQRDQEIFQAKAKEQDVDVIVYNANEDNATQIKQIRLLIEKQVDVMVVIPYDKNGLKEVIGEAKKAGIKVIAYDRLINHADVDAYISFDNNKVGALQAIELTKVVPKGNYIIINGSPDDNNSFMFRDGYMGVLEPFIASGAINIVEDKWANMWREEYAYDIVQKALNDKMQIDAIIGANDRLAEAAIRALSEKGLGGSIYVAGHDADISACQRIVEGTQYMTVYKPIRLLAESAVELAIDLVNGKPIETDESINNGSYDVPYIKLDVLSVTIDTLEETVINDAFHQREDIYREN
ncbi:substrate-binding domain-containing protein [Vallitalea pronyensis]|uniref:Substrate-binding domain-containing protein n=1 Tax=Vallitalea pronyensis TaxID=1348613 RepID=A0A8J8SGH8_9FIRM|nr:substrate-binding domain-containing protein [Vallitalea pronyensis]QUI22333.1 substrate-binding domain-containing protein [Vallitalea pronyensis]